MNRLATLALAALIFLGLLGALVVVLSQGSGDCPSCKLPLKNPAPEDDGGYRQQLTYDPDATSSYPYLWDDPPYDPYGGPRDEKSWVNGRAYESEVVTADYPGSLYIKNIGSHKDGAGMCVMTSITMLAHYLGLYEYYGLRDWCANEPGGAYRQKVDDQIKRYEQAQGIKNPAPYVQYEGPSPEGLLDQLDKARLPFAHTYGWSPRYGHRIAHMVFSCKYNGQYGVVIDNNPMQDLRPESGEFHEWMSRAELVRRMKVGNRDNAWVFAWLVAPPPPCPKAD